MATTMNVDGWKTVIGGAGGVAAAASSMQHSAPPPSTAHAFMFQRRRAPINWRHLAGLDVDRVCREVDIQALQQNISNVTFCNIESEEFQGVDGNFIKLFRLAQLTIEYLLHSQQYLADQKSQFEQQVQQLQKELEACRSEATAKADEIKTIKRENRKRRKMIEAYQDMLNQGATGLHPCGVCSKEFVSQQYLDSHMHRRHPHHLPPPPKHHQGLNQEEIERKLVEQLNEKFHLAEQQLRQELARKESESLQSQAREFEQWKLTQHQKRRSEQEEMQAPLLEQLRTVKKEKEHLQKVLQETQAEVEVMRTQSGAPASSVEPTAHETTPGDTDAATSDVRRLENKVVSKWKKHKKNVHQQMEQLKQTYQTQLIEITEKLASVEHSVQKPKRDKQDDVMKKELLALQKKVTEQEKTLSTQKQQLESLQTHEPPPLSPVSPVSPESSDEEEEGEDEGEGEEEEGGEGGEGGEGENEVDFPETHHFTPFPNRNAVTTLFNHGPEDMDKIRRETVAILDNALLQRGVTKDMAGMSDALLETKMKLIETERQQRVQMHYQFMEQRERLAQEVESAATANCHFQPPRNLVPSSPPPPPSSPLHPASSPNRPATSPSPRQQVSPHRSSSPRDKRGSPHDQTSSPTRKSPVRSQQTSGAGGRVSNKPPTGLPPVPQLVTKSKAALGTARRQLQMDISDSETDTETESESDSGSYEDDQPAIKSTATKTGDRNRRRVSPREREVATVSYGAAHRESARGGGGGEGGNKKRGEGRERQNTMIKQEDDESSWDSEESDDDHLTTQDLMSVPTSTPIQVRPVKTAKVSKTGQDSHKLEEESDNSWDVTETSNTTPPPRPKTNRNTGQTPTQKQTSINSVTGGGNSQSALTTVTHGDFDDSDISDIQLT